MLSKTSVGQGIIKLYHELSPVNVNAMKQDNELKDEIKEMIEGVLPLVRKTVK